MKFSLIALVAFIAIANTKSIEQDHLINPEDNTAYGYLKNFGIPEAERIRRVEEAYLSSQSRIVGGAPAPVGLYPWQAGLIIDIINLNGNAVCGGSLISNTRVVTAAHCWFDGQNQAWRFTVVLGSALLFSGGTRVQTSIISVHSNWSPSLVRNDIAVIHLPAPVTISNTIAPISLPTGSELNENFVGDVAIASGFGRTSDSTGITTNQFLSHVSLPVITNTVCSFTFPFIVQSSNICTSGNGGIGTCGGDSGGPLIVTRNNRPILIGVTSFGSPLGCQSGRPAAYARVTSFINFLNQNLN